MRGTIDHYLPQALGGTNEWDNLRWCCNECNGLKAAMSPQEWATKLKTAARQPTRYERKVALLAGIAPRRFVRFPTNGKADAQ